MWSTGESLIVFAVEGALLYQLGAAALKLVVVFVMFHVLCMSLKFAECCCYYYIFSFVKVKSLIGIKKNLPQE